MQFTEAELKEYMAMWTEEFHESISLEEARLSATALLDLFVLLASPAGKP
jgi:hypothetical protein